MIARTAVLFLVAPVLLPAALQAGPPTICHPVDIGNAESLPMGGQPFDAGDLAREKVVPRTLEILDRSADPLVHMETLRRAHVYLWMDGKRDPAAAHAFLRELKDRALDAAARDHEVGSERQALAWFDLGYATETFVEGGLDDAGVPRPYLEKAGRLDDADARLQFGIATARFMEDTGGKGPYLRHMLKAARLLAKRADPLLEKNARASLENWCPELVAEDFAAVAERIEERLKDRGTSGAPGVR